MSYRDRRDNVPLDCKVYVGNLGSGASRNELENEFGYYGRLVNVWVARNPPGFAYVEFENKHDAKDAVRGLDGKVICGRRAKVELSHGMQRKRNFRPQSDWGGPPRRGMSDVRCFTCNERGHYARDCPRGRSRSRSPRRRSYSRSRSRDRSFSRSRSRSYSRSRSPVQKRSRSRSPSPRRSRSIDKSTADKEDRDQLYSRSRSRS